MIVFENNVSPPTAGIFRQYRHDPIDGRRVYEQIGVPLLPEGHAPPIQAGRADDEKFRMIGMPQLRLVVVMGLQFAEPPTEVNQLLRRK